MGTVAQPSNECPVVDEPLCASDSEAGPAFPTYLGMKPESPPRIWKHRYLKKAPPRGTTTAPAAATQATTAPAATAPEAVPNRQLPAVMEHRVVVNREVEDTPVAVKKKKGVPYRSPSHRAGRPRCCRTTTTGKK